MANSFSNTDMPKIKVSLEDYYTSLFEEIDKKELSSSKIPYFFDTMKNIDIVNNNDFAFNKFINQCIKYKIGTNVPANNNEMLQILSNTGKITIIHKKKI